ncbi:MAG TPA: hypothetical protein VKQ34_01875 [Candidatus Saccharimonadales bacterium]|nr:hypothetical protein [Candidatus Saccharimonadales bacterium]
MAFIDFRRVPAQPGRHRQMSEPTGEYLARSTPNWLKAAWGLGKRAVRAVADGSVYASMSATHFLAEHKRGAVGVVAAGLGIVATRYGIDAIHQWRETMWVQDAFNTLAEVPHTSHSTLEPLAEDAIVATLAGGGAGVAGLTAAVMTEPRTITPDTVAREVVLDDLLQPA